MRPSTLLALVFVSCSTAGPPGPKGDPGPPGPQGPPGPSGNADLSTASDLAGFDLAGADLSGVDLAGADGGAMSGDLAIDPCALNHGGCDLNATCTNVGGAPRCACNAGYNGNGYVCALAGLITWVPIKTFVGLQLTDLGHVVGMTNRIYFADGRGPPYYFDSYDPILNQAFTETLMPATTNDFSAAGYQGRPLFSGAAIYYVGNWAQRYDLAPRTWTSLSYPASAQRGEAAAAIFNNRLYLVGGRTATASTSSTVEYYDLATNTWSAAGAVADYPYSVTRASAAVANGQLFVFGDQTNPSEAASFDGTTWTPLAATPVGGIGAATAFNGKIYYLIACGQLLVYDPIQQSWSTVQLPSIPSSDCALAVVGSTLYLMDDTQTGIDVYFYNK